MPIDPGTGSKPDDTSPAPRIIPRQNHPISRKNIDREALKVLYRLRDAGYVAYLVGGGVRDLYLGKTPKDFDISTDAKPGELRKVFRNSRLIGKRFRLVQVFSMAARLSRFPPSAAGVNMTSMETPAPRIRFWHPTTPMAILLMMPSAGTLP